MDLKEFIQNHEITITSDNENRFKCKVINKITEQTKEFNYDSFIEANDYEFYTGKKIEDLIPMIFSNDIQEYYKIQ